MSRKLAIPAIISIVLLAAGVRIWGLGWGLPTTAHFFSYHPGETAILDAALNVNFLDGQFDTDYYTCGSMYIYMTSAAILIGTISGMIDLSSGDLTSATGELAKLYMSGRIIAVLLGIATVYLVYMLGRRTYGLVPGLLAALLFAVMPLHVLHSKFMGADVPAAFFVVASLIFAARIPEGRRLRDYLLSGLFAGLAAGTQYPAGLVVLAPIAAHFSSGKVSPGFGMSALKLSVLALVAAVGFLIGTPAAVLYPGHFAQSVSNWIPDAAPGLIQPGLLAVHAYPFSHILPSAVTLPLLAVSVLGVLYAMIRRSSTDSVMLLFLVAYCALVGAAGATLSGYAIPILPVLAVLAARFSTNVIGALSSGGIISRMIGYTAMVVLASGIAAAGVYSASHNVVLASEDTRDQAAAWMSCHMPHGASIAFPTVPWSYAPPLDPYSDLSEDMDVMDVRCDMEFLLMVNYEEDWDVVFLERNQPKYIIISEKQMRDRVQANDPSARAYLEVLDSNYHLERRFRSVPVRIPGLLIDKHFPEDISYASPTLLIYSRSAED